MKRILMMCAVFFAGFPLLANDSMGKLMPRARVMDPCEYPFVDLFEKYFNANKEDFVRLFSDSSKLTDKNDIAISFYSQTDFTNITMGSLYQRYTNSVVIHRGDEQVELSVMVYSDTFKCSKDEVTLGDIYNPKTGEFLLLDASYGLGLDRGSDRVPVQPAKTIGDLCKGVTSCKTVKLKSVVTDA